MSKIVTLSGWGQAYDALANIVPEGATHLDYSSFANVAEFFASIKEQNPELVVGWSLGGQLALRAVSEGIFSPKALILLATPYQFVASKEIKCAMDRDSFNLFHRTFASEPEKTINRFIALISLNDSNAHDVQVRLKETTSSENFSRWHYWLEELEHFSCNALDFSKMPKTFAVHGRDDTIVDITQTGLFKSLLPDYTLEVFQSCGHAPHLHNEARVREIITGAYCK